MHRSLLRILLSINIILAILWIYQGLVPKILYHAVDEQRLWQAQGIGEIVMLFMIQISGYLEIGFGVVLLILYQSKMLHVLNIIAMCALSIFVVITDIRYFQQAFNPFIMNIGMAGLSIVALQLIHFDEQLK